MSVLTANGMSIANRTEIQLAVCWLSAFDIPLAVRKHVCYHVFCLSVTFFCLSVTFCRSPRSQNKGIGIAVADINDCILMAVIGPKDCLLPTFKKYFASMALR